LFLIVFILLISLPIILWVLYLPIYRTEPIPGERKAIILSSANDYYRKEGEPDFNLGDDSNFTSETGNWVGNFSTNGYGAQDSQLPGHDSPGVIQLIVKSPATPKYVNMEFVYNWTKYVELIKYAVYNLSAWVNITTNTWAPATIIPTGAGARVGLRWLNSSNAVIRTDWSKGIFETLTGWTMLNATGIADNFTWSEVTQLHLVLAVEGNMTGTDMVLFDDVKVEYWFPPPIPSPLSSNIDTDGFPAQALQVYWILKNNGYTDDNIFLMLYHTGDSIIDIYASDGIPNDLVGAIVDVENDDVNSSRFKQELNASHSGSFASNITSRDKLIIYMVDHGSNKVISDGNATFHFEADDSYITELEFYNLVKQINYASVLINIDICFSGNFLNENANIGSSWYNIPKSILITSTTDQLSWYWRDNNNPDGFAGSWFFHQFWEQLNQSQTIGDAFNYAKNHVPVGQVNSIEIIQTPLIQDNLGNKDTWILLP
jgi:hypothetical protein